VTGLSGRANGRYSFFYRAAVCSIAAAAVCFSARCAAAEPAAPSPLPHLTAAQIVERMVQRNQERSEALSGYTEIRHYQLVYHGFPHLHAAMTVQVTYAAPSTKTYRILSQSGPGLLVNRVLKRLLNSEVEAARDPNEANIDPRNYNFTLLGDSTADGQPCYELRADPKRDEKFFFRGDVCVNATDFAVAWIRAEPAKSPSFWIRKTEIHHVYAKTGQFWLPSTDRSESDIRFGGVAVLTIQYGVPQIETTVASTSADPRSGTKALR
jgi:hypothetical protein